MPRLHAEAAIFCLAWAALAFFGAQRGGLYVGTLIAVGLLLIIMPTSSLILSKTGSLSLERQVRWGILVTAAAALAIWLSL